MKTIAHDPIALAPSLRNAYLFKPLQTAEAAELLKNASLGEYGHDEKIITEHEPSDSLYVVIAGSVRVTVSEKEKDVYICTLGEGDVFGESALFTNLKRTANVVAADDGVQALSIRRDAFAAFIRLHPGPGIKILFMIIYSLLRKLREANMELAWERKEDSGQDDIDKMLAEYTTKN